MTRQFLCGLTLCSSLLTACGGGGGGESAAPILQAALPAENGIGFLQDGVTVSEQQRSITLQVFRAGDAVGEASVQYATSDQSALAGEDYTPLDGTLSWANGETGVKSVELTVHSDLLAEPRETLSVELLNLRGNDPLAANQQLSVSLDDSACSSLLAAQNAGSLSLTDHCYRLSGRVALAIGDTLSMAPGTTLIADADASIEVGNGAVIKLLGTAAKPITLSGSETLPGHWRGLSLVDSSDGANAISFTVVRDAQTGLSMNSLSTLSAFNSNRFTANVYAASLPLSQVAVLDKNSSFAGNINNYLELASGSLDQATIIPALDIPYRIAGTLVSNAGLDVEAGVSMQFNEGGVLFISTSGFLRAVGTQGAPVVFSGAADSAGYWQGIHFSTATDPQNRLDHVRVSDAGGDPARPGNIAVFGGNPVISITNSLVSNSASNGIWVSASQFEIDTTGTVFESITEQDIFEN